MKKQDAKKCISTKIARGLLVETSQLVAARIIDQKELTQHHSRNPTIKTHFFVYPQQKRLPVNGNEKNVIIYISLF